jgi:glycosyltransferase involved in cell wall biosynthesis
MSNVLLIRQGMVPFDPRVKRAIDALIRDGHQVDVLCVGAPGQPPFECSPGLTVRRLRPLDDRRGLLAYVLEYATFLITAAWLAGWLHLRRRYALVQVHSMPDALVFAAAIPKLLGARVVLDLMEPSPEFFASKFRVGMTHPLVRFVAFFEQLSIRFADHVLTCTDQMRDAFVRRGAPQDKITVVLNSTNPEQFDARRFPPRPRSAEQFLLMCHGTVEERYGIDTVIRAVAELKDELPALHFNIYGIGSYVSTLRELAAELGVEDRVSFIERLLPLSQLLRAIADADVGVVAMKRDVFRDITHCNKMFDYIAMHRPAIVSRTAAVQAYFDDDCFELFESGNVRDLARAIRRLYHDPDRCQRLVEHALEVTRPYGSAIQREVYLNAVRRLLSKHRSPGLRSRASLAR